jgi:hypothetical protein
MMKSVLLACMILSIWAHAEAQSLTGAYTGKTEDGETLALNLEEHSDKTISGTMTGAGNVSHLSGRIDGSSVTCTATVPGYAQPIRFVLRRHGEQQLVMITTAGGEAMPPQVFTRTGAASSSAANPNIQKAPRPPAARGAKGESGAVRVNGIAIQADLLRDYEQRYRLRVIPGDYWYDRMNGSWGQKGGPAEGFIMAGLNLGGPLREDASNGDTGVFINSRQLHRVDVARLMLLGPVSKGRCWMDAQGNIGLEGQPPFANIWVAVQSLSGGNRKEGILSSYDKTGAAVIGGEVLMH